MKKLIVNLAIANLLMVSVPALAAQQAVNSDDNSRVEISDNREQPLADEPPVQPAVAAEQLPAINTNDPAKPQVSKAEAIAYMRAHPEEMESLLLRAIRAVAAEPLQDLLPIYQQDPKHDPAIIDWGHAIIATSKGDYKTAIDIFRQINARLPDVQLLRMQMAIALYLDKQFAAAKNEFIKLRAEQLPEDSIVMIDRYIDLINSQNQWSFSAGMSFVHDDNLGNSPPVGTKLDKWTYTTPHESGTGFSYSLSADKSRALDQNYYLSFGINAGGAYYFDNDKYKDLTVGVNAGFGYADARRSWSFSPLFSIRYYTDTDDHPQQEDSRTIGAQFSQSYWLNPKWRYSNFDKVTRNYDADSRDGNGNSIYIGNTFTYMASQNHYYFAGLNLSFRRAKDIADVYHVVGGRLGWGQTWNWGVSSTLSASLSRTKYHGQNFFGIKRENDAFSTNLTLWHRALHFKGLTPQLTYNYNQVFSNSVFDEYHKHSFWLDLSKTF